MKHFSPKWVASKKPRKQRKYVANAPLHIKRDFLKVSLAKPLREKHNRRNVLIRAGDKVRIMRGQYRKVVGKVELVDTKASRVYVEGANRLKKDGSKSNYPLHPSNLQIIELAMGDKKRSQSIQRTVNKK